MGMGGCAVAVPCRPPLIDRWANSTAFVGCSRVWEFNDEGSIPYVPFLRAPFYIWVGRVPRLETLLVENKVRGGGQNKG